MTSRLRALLHARTAFLSIAFAAGFAPTANAANILINNTFGNRIYAEAAYYGSEFTSAPHPINVPSGQTLQATSYGPVGTAYSSVTYSLSDSGFTFDFAHTPARGDTLWFCEEFGCFPQEQWAEGSAGYTVVDLAFIPLTTVQYSLSGFLDAVGTSFLSSSAQLVVQICDNTGGVLCGVYPELFFSNQASLSTPNESFVLGAHGGDYIDDLSGSLTGTMYAFRTYSISIYALFGTGDFVSPYDFPSATGQVQLSFVPEPGTSLLVALGLAGLALRQRRSDGL
jgi:hypothetical protein